MKYIKFLLVINLVFLSGCRTVKYDTVSKTIEHTAKSDSTDKSRHDTQYVFMHDSVFVSQKNDTVTKEVYRTRYLYRYKTDTMKVFKRDTVIVQKTDTIHSDKYNDCNSRHGIYRLVFFIFFIVCVLLYYAHKRMRKTD